MRLNTLIHFTLAALAAAETPLETRDEDSYDYVVVGSGPGGGPLSARLAMAGHKVLLIEAGDDQGDHPKYQVPVLHIQASEMPETAWNFYVNHYSDLERQKQDSKMTYRKPDGSFHVGPNRLNGTGPPPPGSEPVGILYPRAGTLGGCSAHNALITMYPHKSDWNYVADATGDTTWNADNMRGYFKKLERSRYLPNGVVGHGFNGWLTTMVTDISLIPQDLKLLSMVLAAATAMGKGLLGGIISTVTGLEKILTKDINADTPLRDSSEGLYQVPLTMDNYKRVGSREFILQTANEKNQDGSRKYHLDIKLNTLATRVQFDDSVSPPKATGVEYITGQSLYGADPRSTGQKGTPGSVKASKEIILAGGTFNTPQLLKLSGIGPASELAQHNIPLRVDSPGVGTNMQDRYEVTVVGEAATDFALTKPCTFMKGDSDPCYDQWHDSPVFKGVYGSNGLAVSIVKKSSVAEGDADILIAGAPAVFTGYFPGYSDIAFGTKNHWVWLALKAHSRNNAGTVKLRSTNPQDTPLIDFHSFDEGVTTDGADQKDLQALVEGMDFIRKIYKSVIPIGGGFEEAWPGANVTGDGLKEHIKNEAWGHHACCTAKIGADNDKMAVLDSKFRVRGVQGLRVVDASAFPIIPGYFIAVPTYMLSEKAADAILVET